MSFSRWKHNKQITTISKLAEVNSCQFIPGGLPMTPDCCIRPRCLPPTKYQTATVSAVMLLSYAADVLLSGCLRRHFPLSSTNHVAPFRGTRGCR